MFCKSCRSDLPEQAFYARNRSKCKECVKASVRANRIKNIEHYRAFDKARASQPQRVAARVSYQKSEAYARSHRAASIKWIAKHPDRRKANTALGNAVRDGLIKPWPVCAIPECSCKPEAHHPDYSRPLDVVWLCVEHHNAAHHATI